MFNVRGFLRGKLVIQTHMAHLPRNGDTIRLKEDLYVQVTEVIWCFDEGASFHDPMRVNLRFEALKD